MLRSWLRLHSEVVVPCMSPGKMADQNQYFMMLEKADSVHIWAGGVITGLNADVKVTDLSVKNKCTGHVGEDLKQRRS